MIATPKRRDFPQDAALTPSEMESTRAAKIVGVVDAKRLASALGAAGSVLLVTGGGETLEALRIEGPCYGYRPIVTNQSRTPVH
jgi:hypothetical protein